MWMHVVEGGSYLVEDSPVSWIESAPCGNSIGLVEQRSVFEVMVYLGGRMEMVVRQYKDLEDGVVIFSNLCLPFPD